MVKPCSWEGEGVQRYSRKQSAASPWYTNRLLKLARVMPTLASALRNCSLISP